MIRRFFENVFLSIYIKIHTLFINVSISLYNTEQEILKADPNINDERSKKVTRKRHRNEVLEKFYAGQRDEKYVNDYYEILKKSDNFLRKSTVHEFMVASDKHLRFEGDDKDMYGRRYSHFGFFDSQHRHSGKTLGDALILEMGERRTNDDDYELLYIFNNRPIEGGLINVLDITEGNHVKIDESIESHFVNSNGNVVTQIVDVVESEERVLVDINKKSKQLIFPIKISRDVEVINKLEHLTEYLHVKKIAFNVRQLEFFIPLKYKTNLIEDNSDIFFELTKINSIFVKSSYGDLIGFRIDKFLKKIIINSEYEVWKFEGIEMETMKTI